MNRALPAVLSALVLTTAASAAPNAEQRLGASSRLPLPRYESLAAAEAFGRRGPGKDHRIDWVYRARGLPVQVLEEDKEWRRVRDPAGDEVWLSSILLSPNRTVYVKAAPAPGLTLRAAPRPDAGVVAYLEPGVVAMLKECLGGWRKLVANDATGWVPADALWAGEDCALPK